MGKKYDYAPVSTEDRELGLQVTALRDAGVPDANIVREKRSDKRGADRPLYDALLDRLQSGDRLVVWKVDRLGRSTLDALQVAECLTDRGVHIVITMLGVDLATPAAKLVFGVRAATTQYDKSEIGFRTTNQPRCHRHRGTAIATSLCSGAGNLHDQGRHKPSI